MTVTGQGPSSIQRRGEPDPETESKVGFTVGIEFKTDDGVKDVAITAVLNGLQAGAGGLDFVLDSPVELGSLASFYQSAEAQFGFPNLDFATMPSPVPEIVTAIVTVNEFELNTTEGRILVDVTMKPLQPIKIPLFPNLSIAYTNFRLDRQKTVVPPPTTTRTLVR
jgi:hypothetical protein